MGNGVAHHLPGAGSIIARIGVYSYGLYLLHQPYVIYLGERTRQLAVFPSTILAMASSAPSPSLPQALKNR